LPPLPRESIRDMDEAVSVCLQVQHRFVPREREQNDYAHKYAAYLRAYHALSYIIVASAEGAHVLLTYVIMQVICSYFENRANDLLIRHCM